jgi:hypothetical integral membrane protein (TIGR02206 family)
MAPSPAFRPYGPAHLTVIALTLGLPLLFWATARGPGRQAYRTGVRYTLALLLLVNWIAYEINRAMVGKFDAMDALPMQLCDWAMFAVIAALVTRRRALYEVAYFWGLAGTLQAILTPNLREGFPSPWFFCFFIAHCGVVISVLYLTAVEALRPSAGSLLRAMLWSQVYLGAALIVNSMTGANYGFLSHRPAAKSLLDYTSDNHAIYLLQLELLAVAFFLLLYTPFWISDLIRRPTPPVAAVPGSRLHP